jgi:hypothetical protein
VQDKEKGQFCYELLGEAGLPAPMLDYRVTAGLDPVEVSHRSQRLVLSLASRAQTLCTEVSVHSSNQPC